MPHPNATPLLVPFIATSSPIRTFLGYYANMIMKNTLAALVLLCQLLDAHKRRSHLHNGLPEPNRICTRTICHLCGVPSQWEKATIALLHAPSKVPANSSRPRILNSIRNVRSSTTAKLRPFGSRSWQKCLIVCLKRNPEIRGSPFERRRENFETGTHLHLQEAGQPFNKLRILTS
jgi:hypothetical protein